MSLSYAILGRSRIFLSYFSVIILIICHLHFANSHDYGAPTAVCETMVPGHPELPLPGEAPFSVTLDKDTVGPDERIRIDVKPKVQGQKVQLEGVLFVVKNINNARSAFGAFDPRSQDNDLQAIDCFEKKHSGLTHSKLLGKSELKFHWIASNVPNGDYELHVTLARDYSNYWVDLKVPTLIKVRGSSVPISSRSSGQITAIPLVLSAAVALSILFLK